MTPRRCPITPSTTEVQAPPSTEATNPSASENERDTDQHARQLPAQAAGESRAFRKGLTHLPPLEEHHLHHPAPAHHERQQHRRGDQRDNPDHHRRGNELRRAQLQVVVHVMPRQQPGREYTGHGQQRQQRQQPQADKARGHAHEHQQVPPDQTQRLARRDSAAIERAEENRRQSRVLDQPDGQRRDRGEQRARGTRAARAERKRAPCYQAPCGREATFPRVPPAARRAGFPAARKISANPTSSRHRWPMMESTVFFI